MPVIGATQLEPVNVLGSYAQGMELGRAASAQRLKEAEALRAQRQQEQLNQLIGSGAFETAEGRNALMRTPGGLAALEALGTAQEKLGKGTQEQTKGLSDRLQYWKRMLPADPRLAPSWVASAYQDPIVGPELAKLGTPDQVIAGIPTDPAQYPKWMEGVSMFADEYAKRRVPTAESMLPYEQPMSPEVYEQQKGLRGAGASRTTIMLPGRKRGEKLEELGAVNLENEYKAAQSAARGLARDYDTLRLLREGKPSTGVTSEIETNFARWRGKFGGDPESIQVATDSQLLEALLGSQVFEQIQSLGIGARGLDTPAEREFLREVISGTRKLDKDTLIQMAEMRAKYKEDLVNDYNSRIESGELDDFFTNYGKKKQKFEMPERPTAPSAPKVFATEAEAEKAFSEKKLQRGDRVTIGGVTGTWE
jgi:hypothetical protein